MTSRIDRSSIGIVLACALAGIGGRAAAQIPQIAAPIDDIAMASLDAWGNPVIYYNPTIVQQVGPAVAAFFEAHEHAHHILNHVRPSMVMDPYTRIRFQRQAEIDADRFAIDHWLQRDPRVLIGTIQYFESPYGNYGDLTHLPTWRRAAMIRDALRQAGIGPRR